MTDEELWEDVHDIMVRIPQQHVKVLPQVGCGAGFPRACHQEALLWDAGVALHDGL